MKRRSSLLYGFAAVALLSLGAQTSDAQCRFAASTKTTDARHRVTYRFEPEIESSGTILHVSVEFLGGAKSLDEIEVPTGYAGQDFKSIVNLRAASPNTTIEDGSTPGNKTVHHAANQHVVLQYDVIRDWQGPLVHPYQFHPVVTPEYLEINGENALVYPAFDSATTVTANFDWQKMPADWVLATSFGTGSDMAARCQSYTGAWIKIAEGLFTAGQFRFVRFEIKNRPVILAINGTWPFTDQDAAAQIQKAIETVRDFWHDYDIPYFLVTLKSYEAGTNSSDGSGFTNAFWMYLSPGQQISSLMPQLIHEAFHGWNPHKMGYTKDDSETPWFTEGFTQYYEYLLAYRAGFITLQEYLLHINSGLRDYADSTSPYTRGDTIALWLDGEIRRESQNKNSLDAMMFALVRDGYKPLTPDRVLAAADRYLSPEARVTLTHMVQPGSSLPAFADSGGLGACTNVSMDQVGVFDLGFDFKASMAAHQVTGVQDGGPAFKAGLRDGQGLTHWSVYNGYADRAARFAIQGTNGDQTIEYYPSRMVAVPQYHLNDAGQGSGACDAPLVATKSGS